MGLSSIQILANPNQAQCPRFASSDSNTTHNIGLVTKWLRILSLGGIDKIRNQLVAIFYLSIPYIY